MKYIGKFGEHAVLAELLRRDYESYLAIKSNQADYDITTILSNKHVVRLQVKATELQNSNTNNSIDGIEKNYDYLVLVIVDEASIKQYVLTREEALILRGNSAKLGVSYMRDGKWFVKDELVPHEQCWGKIRPIENDT